MLFANDHPLGSPSCLLHLLPIIGLFLALALPLGFDVIILLLIIANLVGVATYILYIFFLARKDIAIIFVL